MGKLGIWENSINLPEMRSWYPELPGDMAKEYARYRPRPEDARSYPNFTRLKKRTVKFVDASIVPFNPAMHNPKMHFVVVRNNGMAAARAYVKRNPHLAPFVQVVLEYFDLALYSHDAGHCACTFRRDAPRGLFLPKLGVDRSAEWVTAYAVNDFMKRQGVSLPARLFMTGVHWASTYGAEAQEGQRLKLPAPRPSTIWGAIMRAADISPEAEDTVRQWFRRSIAVGFGEAPAFPTPKTWEEYWRNEVKFIRYCQKTMGHMNKVAGFALSEELGWDSQFEDVLRAIRQGHQRGPAMNFVRQELEKYGARLR
jgi:hypothetical protein